MIMKPLLLSIISLIIICFELKAHDSSNHYYKPNSAKHDSSNYKVYQIDSINNYYLIYAKKGDALFKIVSKKESIKKCNGIIVNHVYKFQLHSMLFVNGQSIIPANQINEISGWRIDESTTINFEGDSIRDLYYADNIKGLCFIKKKTYRGN
jgi:hypothetical protein